MTTIHRRRPASEGGYTCGDETSARIIEAALNLFGERGYEGASTRALAELAGVNAPALNYYFKNKEGVYSACTEYMVERIWDYLAPTIEAAQALLGTRPDTEQLIDTFCAIQSKIAEFMLVSNRTNSWRKFYAREQAGLGPSGGMSWAGPLGALIGLGLGLLEYRLMSAVVIGALRRTDRSETQAEKDDYERRIRILRAVLVVMTIGLMPVLGFVIGRALFG